MPNRPLLYIIVFLMIVASGSICYAYVADSGSYRIQYDSINSEGGDSSSANYGSSDTMGELGSGNSDSASYRSNAGFQKPRPSAISLTSPGNLALSAIDGFNGGLADTIGAFIVKTDNPAGYNIKIRTDSSPAFRSSDGFTFSNYADSYVDPRFSWDVSSSESAFGFTVEGSKISQRFKDDGLSCNTGTGDTANACWYFISTSDQEIVNSSSPTNPSGETTSVKFKYETGSEKLQENGSYFSNITITALPN